MGFMENLVQSIFEPGVNKSLEKFTYCVFVLLIVLLVLLLIFSEFNIHLLIMLLLSCGLLASLAWFINETKSARASEQEKSE